MRVNFLAQLNNRMGFYSHIWLWVRH